MSRIASSINRSFLNLREPLQAETASYLHVGFLKRVSVSMKIGRIGIERRRC